MNTNVKKAKNRKNNTLLIILLLLLILSLFCVLKFSKIEILEFLPDGIKKLFLCPREKTDAYEIWSFMNNLSLAYIASFIFYIVVDVIPMKVKQKKALIIISNKLIIIYKNMSYIIRAVLFEIGEKKEIKDIELADLKKVEAVFFNTSIKYADITHIKNGKDINVKDFSYELLDQCKACEERINKTIDEIFSMQIAGNISDELIELLSEIRQSRLLHMLSLFNHDNTRKIPGHESIAIYFDKSFWDMIIYRERLSNYHFDLLDYRFESMSEEEINNEREKRIFYLGRSSFMHVPVERLQEILSYMPNIKLNEQSFKKLNGVLMEALIVYDIDNKKYGYMLSIAKNIAEYLCKFEGIEEYRDISVLNYLQVLRRIGTYSKKHFQPARDIISDTNKGKEYRLGALIILKNFAEAQIVFEELDEDKQKQIATFPIYRLWDNPPMPANIEQPDFLVYE
ncbi:hypothetical protein [Butyrivibrio hungatei]|uniref:hypothetical protein n=1 Tax=Butyrivibrio hungatei TaxID=185008 RepID=UPI0004181AE9|nr:hypothetical protein [Butyrivibrio hungatei]